MPETRSDSITVVTLTPSVSDSEGISSSEEDATPARHRKTVHFDEAHEPHLSESHHKKWGPPFTNVEYTNQFIRRVLICGSIKYAICATYTAVCLFIPGVYHDFLRSHYSISVGVPCLAAAIILALSVAFCPCGRGKPGAVNIITYIVSILLWSKAFGVFGVYLKSVPILVAPTTNFLSTAILAVCIPKTARNGKEATYLIIWKIISAIAILIFGILITIFILAILRFTDVNYLKLYDTGQKGEFYAMVVIFCLYSAFIPFTVYLQLKSVVRDYGGRWQFRDDDWLIFSVRCFY